jgi:hypothetical protein
MSLESSASYWDRFSDLLLAVGALIALAGTLAVWHAKKLGRELAIEKDKIAVREKAASDRSIADANARAEEAHAEAEKARLETAKIELRLHARRLWNDPYTLTTSAEPLKKIGAEIPVLIQFIDNQEARNFGIALSKKLPVWQPKIITEQDSGISDIPDGISIFFWGDGPNSEAAATALRGWIRSNSTTAVDASTRAVPPARSWEFRHSPARPEWSIPETPFKGFQPLPPKNALLVLIGEP